MRVYLSLYPLFGQFLTPSKQIFLGNFQELEGRELRVNSGPPPPRRERDSAPLRGARGGSGSGNGNRVHVGNLAWGIEHSDLESLFAEQGKVLEARVIYDKESGRSKGFGFVTYSSAEEVKSAIESLNGVVSLLNFSLDKSM